MDQEAGVRRLVVAVTLVVAVLCLTPAAHGSPPDQAWIGGFYDDADFDDVIFLITSKLGVVERSTGCSLRPQGFVLLPTDSDTRLPSSPSSALSRAPPTIRDEPSWEKSVG